MVPFTVVEAPAAPMRADNIDTDQIIPARFLRKPRKEGYQNYLFHDDRFGADGAEKPDFVLNSRAYRGAQIIVAGKNFGMSPKMNGFVAMHALGLGLLCESMPFLAYRAAVGVGLRIMSNCQGITSICETGDDVEIDYRTGLFINHTRNIERQFPPIPETLRELIELGGNTGWLKRWWATRNSAGAAADDTVPSS